LASAPVTPFPVHVRTVVRSLRGAFSDLLSAVGADPQDSQSICRVIGLNKNLAWRFSKLIQADDPCVALAQLPGGGGLKIFFKSLQRAGSSPELLQAGRAAVEEYERLIEVHSGDRATLEMMGSELSPFGRQERDEYHRKMLFQGASYVWGVQTRVMLKIGIVGPGHEDGLLEFASLSGLIDFRRLRSDVSWVVASRRSTNDDGSDMSPAASEPLDPRCAGAEHAPLMTDFCSQPLPELRRVVNPTGATFELIEGPVGNTGARTCVVGTIQRRIPYYRTPENTFGENSARCDTPAELMIVDLLIHERFEFAIPPRVTLNSELGAAIPYPGRGRDQNRLPLFETMKDFGAGAAPLVTPEVRQYRKMVQAMFDRTGWNPGEFRNFRIKVAYPVCPSALVMQYDLPAAPKA
jgi:hypothetical protein